MSNEENLAEARAREARRAYAREYAKNNKERLREYRKEWERNNPEKVKGYQLKYWSNKSVNT